MSRSMPVASAFVCPEPALPRRAACHGRRPTRTPATPRRRRSGRCCRAVLRRALVAGLRPGLGPRPASLRAFEVRVPLLSSPNVRSEPGPPRSGRRLGTRAGSTGMSDHHRGHGSLRLHSSSESSSSGPRPRPTAAGAGLGGGHARRPRRGPRWAQSSRTAAPAKLLVGH
jgi:hypothetical protein